jgi:hypothetical protein
VRLGIERNPVPVSLRPSRQRMFTELVYSQLQNII